MSFDEVVYNDDYELDEDLEKYLDEICDGFCEDCPYHRIEVDNGEYYGGYCEKGLMF